MPGIVVNELLTKLGFKLDESKMSKYDKLISNAQKKYANASVRIANSSFSHHEKLEKKKLILPAKYTQEVVKESAKQLKLKQKSYEYELTIRQKIAAREQKISEKTLEYEVRLRNKIKQIKEKAVSDTQKIAAREQKIAEKAANLELRLKQKLEANKKRLKDKALKDRERSLNLELNIRRRMAAEVEKIAKKQAEKEKQANKKDTKQQGVTAGASIALGSHIGGGIKHQVETYADIQQSLNIVQAISNATDEQRVKLQGLAILGSKISQFSAIEITKGMEELARSGFTAEQMLKMMPGVITLSQVSQTNLARSSEMLGATLHQFGLDAKDSVMVTDIFATAVNRSALNISALRYSLQFVGSVARTAGQTLKDTSILLAIMANNGISAQKGGTALRSAFVNLSKPTKQMSEVLTKYNLKIKDSQGNMRKMLYIIQDLQKAMADRKIGNVEKNADLAKLFGKPGMPGISAIMNAGKHMQDAMVKTFENIEGSGVKSALKINTGYAYASKQMEASFFNLNKVMGEQSEPIFTGVTMKISEMVNKISEAPPAVHKLMVAIEWLGGATLIIGGIIIAFKTLHFWLGAVNIQLLISNALMFGWIFAILAGITLLGLAFQDLYMFMTGGKSVIGEVLNWINNYFKKKFGVDIRQVLNNFYDWLGKFNDKVKNLWSGLMESIRQFFYNTFAVVIPPLIDYVLNPVKELINSLKIAQNYWTNTNSSLLAVNPGSTWKPGGTQNLGGVQIANNINVQGSHATPPQIASAASQGTTYGLNRALANLSLNYGQ